MGFTTRLTHAEVGMPEPWVTIFPNYKAFRFERRGLMTPEAIVDMLETTKPAASKADAPFIKLAEFGDERSPQNCLRFNDNVIAVYGIEGDYDAELLSLKQAAKKLKRAGISAILYTSASHTPEAPHWRVLAFLSRPIKGATEHLDAERKKYVGIVNAVLGGVLAPESFALSTSYYFGPIKGKPRPQVLRVDGACIDQIKGLPEPIYAKGKKVNETEYPQKTPEELRTKDPARTRAQIKFLKNNDAPYQTDPESDQSWGWFEMLCAIKGAFRDEEGWPIAEKWSAQSAKDNVDRDTKKVWDSIKPPRIGAEAIEAWAIDAGWKPKGGTKLQVVQELNQRLAFVLHESKAAILCASADPDYPGTQKIVLSRVQDIKHDYANQYYKTRVNKKGIVEIERKPKFDLWMHHSQRRRVRRLTLKPGDAPGYDADTKDWNLWQGWGVTAHEPDSKHSWQKLRKHIRRIVANGNTEYATYILNWLAFCVQHPAVMPEVALVLQGGEGAGKGIVFKAMVKLFGRHGLHLSSRKQLVGDFNAHLKDNLFVFADEAFFAGDKPLVGALKALITEPLRVIEPKFIDAYQLPNYSKVAMASNETWVVPADVDARRFAIFDVSTERVNDLEYFKAIGEELRNGGHEAMLWDLQHRDLSDFDPRNYPQTKALFNQKRLTFDAITTWWFERLCASADEWTSEAARNVVSAEIAERSKLPPHELRALETKIGLTLRRLCPELLDKRRRTGKGNSKRLRIYKFPALDACRAAFAKALHMSSDQIDWKTGEQVTP